MRLYLDDNIVDRHLVGLLRKKGHEVTIPSDVGMAGKSDPRHLIHALHHRLALLTRNYEDFTDLHDVIVAAGGSHPGIILIREDNDRTRDMHVADTAAAIGKLEQSGTAIANQLIVLNHWR